MIVKYNRVSSNDQNLDRQNLNHEKFDAIINEIGSGGSSFFERKGGRKLLQIIASKNVEEVHVSSIDRLGRNIIDILTVIEFFNKKQVNLFVENIGLFSLIEKKPNSTFNLIISVLGNVAQMEREFMLSRQRAGIEIAKIKGIYKGRLPDSKQTKEQFITKYKTAYLELKSGATLKRASLLGECSIGTCQRLMKAIKNENDQP
ncbi:MAG: transposase [Flavobacteriaceae bacterium]|nr:transposase [Flavobacteriaceae bacterium]|tara:strand:- start:1627 stop:2235 length:609 start_codon:yes stop_codon:yes gene_type:complete